LIAFLDFLLQISHLRMSIWSGFSLVLRVEVEGLESALMVLEFVVVAAELRSAGHIFFSCAELPSHRIEYLSSPRRTSCRVSRRRPPDDVGLIGEQMLKPALHCGHGALEVAFRCGEEFFNSPLVAARSALVTGLSGCLVRHLAWEVGLERVTPLV